MVNTRVRSGGFVQGFDGGVEDDASVHSLSRPKTIPDFISEGECDEID